MSSAERPIAITALRSGIAVSFGVLLITALIFPAPDSAGAQNLLRNGDFSAGIGNLPLGWHTDSWVDLPTTKYVWIKPHGGEPGMVSVENRSDNAARWVQSLHLNPGWYYVGAQVETIDVGMEPAKAGAMVGLTGIGVVPNDLKGSHDWQTVSFYLKVGEGGADAQVALGLGFFNGYDTGQALFRGASVVPIDAPPDASDTIDLDEVNAHFGRGSRWSLLLPVVPLLATIVWGWIMFRPSAPST